MKTTIKTFGGLNRGTGADLVPPDQFIQCDNMWGKPDYESDGFLGILSKIPAASNFKTTTPAAGRGRGMYQYFKDWHNTAGNNFLMLTLCTTDYSAGSFYALDIDNNTWYTLASTALQYPSSCDVYSNKVYAQVGTNILKWNGDTTNWNNIAPTLKDKGGTWTAIAGATLTWNETTTVTSNIDISAIVSKGDYIRKSSSSDYADEILTIDGAGTTITLSAASLDTGASAAGGAQQAPDYANTAQYSFLKIWKTRLWLTGNGNEVAWSVPADLEDMSSTALGAGSTNIGNKFDYSSPVVCMETLGDIAIFFRDRDQFIYRYSTDLDAPLGGEYIAQLPYGSPSFPTVKNTGDAIIYWTGTEVRITNGNSDVSITTPQMAEEFATGNAVTSAMSYYVNSLANTLMPWAVYDWVQNTYTITFPAYIAVGVSYTYDLNKNMWTGKRTSVNAACGEIVYSNNYSGGIVVSTRKPILVTATGTSTNQLKQYNRETFDYTNAATLFSGPVDSQILAGESNLKLRIKSIEFVFHPKVNCDTTIKFNWWDFGENKAKPTSGSTGEQTYNLASSGSSTEQRIRHTFDVGEEMYKFGWCFFETVGGTNGWGIIEWTIEFDVIY